MPDLDAPDHVVDRLALLKFSQDISRKNALPHQKLPNTNVFLSRSADTVQSRASSPDPHKKQEFNHKASLRRPLSSFSSQSVATIRALKETPTSPAPLSPDGLPLLGGAATSQSAGPGGRRPGMQSAGGCASERKAVVARALYRRQRTMQAREELESQFHSQHTFHPEGNPASRALIAAHTHRPRMDRARKVQTEFKEEPSKGWNEAVLRLKKGAMSRLRTREVWGERTGIPFSKAIRFPAHYQSEDIENMEFDV
eukprot:CAMPEP_0196597282 /NCGR_PEP_ID=MMETSP1081-20130531/90565_1 /TAXON_ID=36882 /ORGANISM="Pyramimonas amylifera, Strain CCMP720" /LENGTH=254 /DNA_ID=CAMNT_0041922617 /DNA_START=526 /DNA_END=1290 /DNA_ORIENTATION=+